jgi:hypothetical protein
MATESYPHLWAPTNNFDGDAEMFNASTIVDQVDSDFLTMEIEIPASNACFDLSLDDDDNDDEDDDYRDPRSHISMCSIVSYNDYEYNLPHSPAPQRQQASFDFSSQITPDQKIEEIQLPDSTELHMQYQNTLKKLAKSMRRSDATRSVIKRQRKFSPSLSFESDDETDFFTSPRCQQLEQSRKRLFRVINGDA